MNLELDRPAGGNKGLWQGISAASTRSKRRVAWWVHGLLLLALVSLASLGGGEVTACAAAPLPGGCASPQLPRPASVRIEHQTKRLASPGVEVVLTTKQSGTVVGPHTILTHGHYNPFRDPRYTEEEMAFVLQDENTLMLRLQPMSDIGTPYADGDTTLLVLPDEVTLPDPVALGDPAALRNGDVVFVVYWDDARHQFAILETTVLNTSGWTVAKDPDRVIGPGDSGGGVYNARGELVGNVQSILLEGEYQRLPWIKVALLPVGIQQHVRG
jgi:hypothetical protein